ncbi:MAG TPA: methyltransferase domain-containing protein [Polyangiaceae bacterium]|jgi:ubiquinone/menaquinone biosynthesis C-methylase UbiE
MAQPSPLAMPFAWNLVAAGYAETSAVLFVPFAERALVLGRVSPGARVVDVACGPGTLAAVASRAGMRVDALDFSTEMIGQLRERIAREGLEGIEPVVGDGMALPYADASFDAAFSLFGLFLFPDRAKGLGELRRVLRPGGRAIVSSWVPFERVPIMAETFAAIRAALPELPFGEGKAPLATVEEAKAEVAGAGFTDVEVHEVSRPFEATSVADFFVQFRRGAPQLALLEQKLGKEASVVVEEAVLRRLRARFGEGAFRAEMIALMTVGTRAA